MSTSNGMEQMHTDNYEQQQKTIAEKMSRIKRSIIVLSGKGGVGKTSVAVNLAYALARRGKQVGIMDIDLHGPNIAKMLGIEDKYMLGTDHFIEPVMVTDHLRAVSVALSGANPDQPVIWRGPMKAAVIRQFLADTNWGELDYLVIDAPPGTGDEPLSAVQSIPILTGAVIVTTPQDVAILDSRKSVMFARQLNIPVIGIIENMSGYVCPHCGKESDPFKSGGGEKAAESLFTEFLGRIPFDPAIVQCGDSGTPFSAHAQDGLSGKAFAAIVEKIENFKQEA